MTVTDIKIENIEEEKTRLVAYASVTLDDALTINKIKILKNKYSELFIAFPSRKQNENYYSLVEVSNELYSNITKEVLSEYKRINE